MTNTVFPGERWRAVAGWTALNGLEWFVSDFGRVCRGWPERDTRFLYSGQRASGYLTITLTNGTGLRSRVGVHALVMAAFVGPRPRGLVVNHRDGDKANNRLENLEYTTHRRNILHWRMVRSGELPPGASANDALVLAREAA